MEPSVKSRFLPPIPYYVRDRLAEVCDVQLIDHHHPVYKAWSKDWQRRQRPSNRATDPVSAEFGRRMQAWEYLLRKFLFNHGVLVCAERYLAFKDRAYGRSERWRRNCREIDVVVGQVENPGVFVEIKTRERAEPFARGGYAQLTASLAVASARWTDVRGLLVNIYVGQVLGLSGTVEGSIKFSSLSSIPKELKAIDPKCPAILWLDGQELFDYGVRVGTFKYGDLAGLTELRQQTRDPEKRVAKSAEEGSQFNSLGDALRAATIRNNGAVSMDTKERIRRAERKQ